MICHLCYRYNTCITAQLFHWSLVWCVRGPVYMHCVATGRCVWAVPCVVCNLCICYVYWAWWKPRGTLVDNKSIFYRANQTNGWLKTPESIALLWSLFTVRWAQLSGGMREIVCEPLDYGVWGKWFSRSFSRTEYIWSTEQHHVNGAP